MARMKDVDVDFISLVSKGANKQKIQIYKADEEPENPNNEDNEDIEEVTGFFNVLKSFFTKEEIKEEAKVKGFNERITTREVMDNIWRVNDTLVSVMRDVLAGPVKDKETAISTAIDEHGAYLKAKLKGINGIKKTDFLNDEGGMEDMKKEDLQEIIKEAISPINEKIEAIEKELNPETPEPEIETKQDGISKEDITKAVTDALAPLTERIEKIENHKGISKQLEGEEEEVKKESSSIFAGINI